MMDQSSAELPAVSFAALLRQLRMEARLTQEELAYAAGLSPRSISDLERGISRTARKQTATMLADALALAVTARQAFVAAARGRAPASEVLAARAPSIAETAPAAVLWPPRDNSGLALYDTKLGQLIEAITAAAASQGSAIGGIWLIGLTALAATEPTPP
jgi:transcriptional regulator with XRE-family HTH domain